VDAFTRNRFTGNPATVVLDADGCGDATLAAIAREFSHAEVAFVSAASAHDHDVRLRFFNARKEAPFVGHATVAAHAVLLALGRRSPGVCRQHSGTGIIEVRAVERDGTLIEFRQTAAELSAPLPRETTLRVAAALRLPASQLHHSMPALIARRGSSRLLIPLAHPAALDAVVPDFDGLVALGSELGAEGFFLFALAHGAAQRVTESRMFCPALGIPEDPVSGNAHAMLAAYLWQAGQLDAASSDFVGHQGRHVQRPGEVHVTLESLAHGAGDRAGHDGRLGAVRIGGHAVIVSEGTLGS